MIQITFRTHIYLMGFYDSEKTISLILYFFYSPVSTILIQQLEQMFISFISILLHTTQSLRFSCNVGVPFLNRCHKAVTNVSIYSLRPHNFLCMYLQQNVSFPACRNLYFSAYRRRKNRFCTAYNAFFNVQQCPLRCTL